MTVSVRRNTVSERRADRFMRRLLRVQHIDRSATAGAHRAFRTSLVVSGIRCLVSYLLVPILVPVISFAGAVAAPISIALCGVAYVNGVFSVRRFWVSDHRHRWMYTGFMGAVFLILGVAVVVELVRLTVTSSDGAAV